MTLYFIRGTNCDDCAAVKLKLKKNADVARVINNMESNKWRHVTRSVYNTWRNKFGTSKKAAL